MRNGNLYPSSQTGTRVPGRPGLRSLWAVRQRCVRTWISECVWEIRIVPSTMRAGARNVCLSPNVSWMRIAASAKAASTGSVPYSRPRCANSIQNAGMPTASATHAVNAHPSFVRRIRTAVPPAPEPV